MEIAKLAATATMSSREIAQLIEKQHNHIKVSADTLARKGVIGTPVQREFTHNGNTYTEYLLNKRDSLILVAQNSPEFTARIVDRWQELEAQLKAPEAKQIDQEHRAFQIIPDVVRAAQALGFDNNAAAISANQAVAKMTGTNVLQLLGSTHLVAEKQALAFTPTELGQRMGVSGRKFNMLLAEAGLQSKKGEHWAPMPPAEGFYRVLDTGKRHGDGAPIQQIKWFENVLALLGPAADPTPTKEENA